jgi:phosphoglycerate dehydrogenase-like enzyme
VIRRLPEAAANQSAGEWKVPDALLPWPRTALILGLGSIGLPLATLLRGLGIWVIGMVRNLTPERRAQVDQLVDPTQWRELLGEVDLCFNCLPNNAGTQRLLDDDAMDRLPDHAVIVNVGRAGTLDLDALTARLHAGSLGGAALDVLEPIPTDSDDPLWRCPRLLITPKMAVFHPYRQEQLEGFIEEQLRRWCTGETPQHKVDIDQVLQ